MLTGTLPVLYFGKVPAHGDFVRHNAGGAALQSMDAWLQQGLRFARNRLTGTLDAVYDAAGTCCFYFVPRRAGEALMGVLRPSRDSVGRTYPLLIALEVEASALDARRLAQVPPRFNTFFEQASEIARAATAGQFGRDDLRARTEPLGTLVGDEARGAAYFQKTSLSSFFERLWGHPQDSRKYLLFKSLLDILESLRGGIPTSYPLVLRFPLCPDGHTLDFDASFWLEVCLRLLGFPDLHPTFFWTIPEAARDPFLLLSLRPPPGKMFSFLLADQVENDILCKLEAMNTQHAALAALSIPSRIGALLESEHVTLWDFLRQL